MEHWQMVNGQLREVTSNTAEDLWINACSYFKWCDENPIIEKDTIRVGKEAGKEYEVRKKRVYNIKALCLHCQISEEYIKDMRNLKDTSNDYYNVVSKILYVIYAHVHEGAMVDIYNPIFSSKVLNMDKEEIQISSSKVTIVQGLPKLSRSENEILEKLELEKRPDENTKEE